MSTIIRLLTLAAILLGTTSPVVLAAPPQTGIQGQSFYIIVGFWSEIEPGYFVGVGSIQLPAATSFTVRSAHNGREITRVATDSNGFYSVSLPPGQYVLEPDVLVLNSFLNCTVSTGPIEFEVKARSFTLLNVFYATQGFGCPIIAGTSTP